MPQERDSKGHFVRKGTISTSSSARQTQSGEKPLWSTATWVVDELSSGPSNAAAPKLRDSKGHFVKKEAVLTA